MQVCARLDLKAVSLINMCTNLTQTLQMQLSLGKCVLCIYVLSGGKKYMLSLSKLRFCFFQGDTILVGGERVASTPQGSVGVCMYVCVCAKERENVCVHVRMCARERESGVFVSVRAFAPCVLSSLCLLCTQT